MRISFFIIIVLITSCSKPCQSVNRRYVVEGDSYSTTDHIKWNNQLPDSMPYFTLSEQVNYAMSGGQVVQMKNEYNTQAHLSSPTSVCDDYWFFMYAGINDLSALGLTGDSIYTNLKYIWARAKSDRYKVVAFTVINSLYLTPKKELEREKLNMLILSNHSLYDYVIDVANVFDPRIDFSVFADNTHLNATGYKKFAGIVAHTINK